MWQAISRIVFWTYSRGSWQYDILCGVILLFIFLTPASVFDGSAFHRETLPPPVLEREEPEDPEVAVVGPAEGRRTANQPGRVDPVKTGGWGP